MAEIREKRMDAKEEAMREFSFVQSRLSWFIGTVKSGAETGWTDGIREFTNTKRCLDLEIRRAIEDGLDSLYIEGGWNGALNPQCFACGEYEPWVSEWSVLVWSKE